MPHNRDESHEHGDPRVRPLLRSLSDDDFDRTDPPPQQLDDLLAAVNRGVPPGRGGTVPGPVEPTAEIVHLRWRRPTRRQLAAAAAVAAAAVATTSIVVNHESEPARRVVASAQLEQLEPLGRTAARAQLVDADGEIHLVINASHMAPPPEGSAYELWLIDREVTDPRSLGTVTGNADVIVPATIDTAAHPIVDISLEPDDGDSAHSGHSLMRGEFD